jgi:gas vesicle protein
MKVNRKLYRKTYANMKESIERAISASLMQVKADVQEQGMDSETAQNFIDHSIGDAIHDVIDNVTEDLPDITKAMLDEEDPMMEGQDEEAPMDEELFDEDEEIDLSDDGGMDDMEDEGMDDGEEIDAIAQDIEEVKAKMMAQAKRLASRRKPDLDTAAMLRSLAKRL